MSEISDAIEQVRRRFPIDGYMSPGKSTASLASGTAGAYETIATTARRFLPRGASILDFGCGPCDKTAILQALGFECAGCDDLQEPWHEKPGQRDSILAFARDSGIDFRLNNDSRIPFEAGRFDMVMMHDVLEHIHDSPRELLNDLLEMTTPEGLLFVTVPNQVNIRKRVEVLLGRTNLTAYETFYWSDIPWRGHVREYVRDDLVKLADYLGLDVLELRAVDHMLQRISPAAKGPYLLATALFNGWKDSWLMVARKKPGWHPRRRTTPLEQKEILSDMHW